MAQRDLGKADVSAKRAKSRFMLPMAVAMHQRDGDGPDARVIGRDERRSLLFLVQFAEHFASDVDACVNLDDLFVQHRRQDDMQVEDPRTALVTDPQRVRESLVGDKCRAVTGSLEEGVGCDRGAHFDVLDRRRRDRRAGRESKEVAYALDGGIPVSFGVLGQQLVADQSAVRAPGDHIGERAAPVYPYLPH